MIEVIGLVAIGLVLAYVTFAVVVGGWASLYFSGNDTSWGKLAFVAACVVMGFVWKWYFGLFEISVKVTT